MQRRGACLQPSPSAAATRLSSPRNRTIFRRSSMRCPLRALGLSPRRNRRRAASSISSSAAVACPTKKLARSASLLRRGAGPVIERNHAFRTGHGFFAVALLMLTLAVLLVRLWRRRRCGFFLRRSGRRRHLLPRTLSRLHVLAVAVLNYPSCAASALPRSRVEAGAAATPSAAEVAGLAAAELAAIPRRAECPRRSLSWASACHPSSPSAPPPRREELAVAVAVQPLPQAEVAAEVRSHQPELAAARAAPLPLPEAGVVAAERFPLPAGAAARLPHREELAEAEAAAAARLRRRRADHPLGTPRRGRSERPLAGAAS